MALPKRKKSVADLESPFRYLPLAAEHAAGATAEELAERHGTTKNIVHGRLFRFRSMAMAAILTDTAPPEVIDVMSSLGLLPGQTPRRINKSGPVPRTPIKPVEGNQLPTRFKLARNRPAQTLNNESNKEKKSLDVLPPVEAHRQKVKNHPKTSIQNDGLELTQPSPLLAPLYSLTDYQCRASVNDPPIGYPHLFCGHETMTGSQYCPYHTRLYYKQHPAFAKV